MVFREWERSLRIDGKQKCGLLEIKKEGLFVC